MIIGLLHPGRMGAAIGALLTGAGHRVLWCAEGRSADSAARAGEAGLESVPTLAELLAAAEVVFSVCPPAAATELAGQVADAGFDGIFVEGNAISPQRMGLIAGRSGPGVVDGAIIGPPPSGNNTARFYLSGPAEAVAVVSGLLAGTAAEPVSLGTEIGQASALKMAFGSFQKTSRALAAVSHALAGDYGVTDELLAEAVRLGGNALADPGHFPSAAARAWRWAPEMREAADTLRAAGLPGDLPDASAETMARWAPDRDNWTLDVPTTLNHLHNPPA